jgi:hypothetical protein
MLQGDERGERTAVLDHLPFLTFAPAMITLKRCIFPLPCPSRDKVSGHASRRLHRLAELPPSDVVTTVISYEEQMRGVFVAFDTFGFSGGTPLF